MLTCASKKEERVPKPTGPFFFSCTVVPNFYAICLRRISNRLSKLAAICTAILL